MSKNDMQRRIDVKPGGGVGPVGYVVGGVSVSQQIVGTFLELGDTPAAYSGHGLDHVAVTGTEDALEFVPRLWEAGEGTESIQAVGDGALATGDYSLAQGHNVEAGGERSAVIGGENVLAWGLRAAALNTYEAGVYGDYSTVISGDYIEANGYADTFVGGEENYDDELSEYNAVVGGSYHELYESYYGVMLGGTESGITGDYPAILGGYYNFIEGGEYCTIAGGYWNEITGGDTNTIIGASYATITADGWGAMVVGGDNAVVSSTGGMAVGGDGLIVSGDYGMGLGGDTNTISGELAATLAGANNTASGAGSVIVGGSGNDTDSLAGAVIVAGTNVTAVRANALHTSALVIDTVDTAPGSLPTGSVYADGQVLKIVGQTGGFNFTDLDDTPAAYTGKAGWLPVVNGDENGLEFIEGIPGEFVGFRSALTTDQTIADDTATKLTLATEAFDEGSYYDAATNYRWTPPAGHVLLTAKVRWDAHSTALLTVTILKNGSVLVDQSRKAQPVDATPFDQQLTTIDEADGDDYYELQVHQVTGGAFDVLAAGTLFAGAMLKITQPALDASAVTYTPATAGDWDGDADPGDVNDALDQLAARQVSGGSSHQTIMPQNYSGTGGSGTWNMIRNTSSLYDWYLRLDSPADGDYINYETYLDAGTYTLLVIHHNNTSGGIVDVDIGGSEVASIDMYGSLTWNVRSVTTSISVATAGLKQIRLRVDGKNGSSSSYVVYLVYLALWRTA